MKNIITTNDTNNYNSTRILEERLLRLKSGTHSPLYRSIMLLQHEADLIKAHPTEESMEQLLKSDASWLTAGHNSGLTDEMVLRDLLNEGVVGARKRVERQIFEMTALFEVYEIPYLEIKDVRRICTPRRLRRRVSR